MSAATPARRGRPKLVVAVSEPPRALRTRVSAGLAAWLAAAAPRSARGTVAIALVSDRRMRALNTQFRGVASATDVLSFPAEDEPPPTSRRWSDGPCSGTVTTRAARSPRRKSADKSLQDRHLGDLAIAVGVARRQAAEHRHSLRTELRILALHGLLHLLGYDHEQDQGEMRAVEERVRRRSGLPPALIARASTSRTRR